MCDLDDLAHISSIDAWATATYDKVDFNTYDVDSSYQNGISATKRSVNHGTRTHMPHARIGAEPATGIEIGIGAGPEAGPNRAGATTNNLNLATLQNNNSQSTNLTYFNQVTARPCLIPANNFPTTINHSPGFVSTKPEQIYSGSLRGSAPNGASASNKEMVSYLHNPG